MLDRVFKIEFRDKVSGTLDERWLYDDEKSFERYWKYHGKYKKWRFKYCIMFGRELIDGEWKIIKERTE